ncbi:hypothetical protein COCON_G00175680 [Conger conger]|uniref:Uncharacterized protein n=1 Tax=Conger conger TaxID=82655 RepID=A0A9Q1D4N8_CONCO|nr:hypothetical protein COCON_G00175680 [Conger conger]
MPHLKCYCAFSLRNCYLEDVQHHEKTPSPPSLMPSLNPSRTAGLFYTGSLLLWVLYMKTDFNHRKHFKLPVMSASSMTSARWPHVKPQRLKTIQNLPQPCCPLPLVTGTAGTQDRTE